MLAASIPIGRAARKWISFATPKKRMGTAQQTSPRSEESASALPAKNIGEIKK